MILSVPLVPFLLYLFSHELSKIFGGQVMGTSVGSFVFLKYGWRAAAALNMALITFDLVILLVRGPHCSRYTWFGYEGGIEPRKSVVEERKRLQSGAENGGQECVERGSPLSRIASRDKKEIVAPSSSVPNL